MSLSKPILDLMDEFLNNQDIRENSRTKYRANLHVFIVWLSRNADVKNPQRSDIIRYKQWLINSGKKSQTIDNYLAPVRQFYKYLAEHNYYEDIAAGVHSPKKSMAFRKDHLRPEQVQQLLSSISKSSIIGLRDFAIINLMVRTGMRCIEVSRLDVADITIEGSLWVAKVQGKGRTDKDRILGITDKVVEPIKQYFEKRENLNDKAPAFANHSHISHNTRINELTISKIVKRHLRAIGIDSIKLSAHSLRHTFAVTALTNGATVYQVQQMLGHKDVKTTSIYLESLAAIEARKGTAVRLLDNAFKSAKNSHKNRHISDKNYPNG